MTHAVLMRGLVRGLASGAIWGAVALLANNITGVFPMESTLTHNLMAFTVAGGLMGAVAGAFLSLAYEMAPSKVAGAAAVRRMGLAVFVTTALWFVLLTGGVLLSFAEQGRYHYSPSGTLQGLVLAILLGITLGLVWKPRPNPL